MCKDKTKMRLLIRAYLSLKEEGTAYDISAYLNKYFRWNNQVSPSKISSLLRDGNSPLLKDIYKRVNEAGFMVYYLSRNPKNGELRRNLQYIRETKYGFKIIKYTGGKNKYFGTYQSIDEAIKYRDYCMSNGWSEELRLKLLHGEVVI